VSEALELAFSLSILFEGQKHQVPCHLEISKPIDLERVPVPPEVAEAARIWSERKLPRNYYKFKEVKL